MASSVKYVRCPPNSANLAEARVRVIDFFKTACRSIPKIMEIYNIDDVVTPAQLRSIIASEVRKNEQITNPKVIDLLVFKGTEELNNVVEHSKQRHHIIGQYILGRKEISQDQDQGTKVETQTPFLQNFFKGNYC